MDSAPADSMKIRKCFISRAEVKLTTVEFYTATLQSSIIFLIQREVRHSQSVFMIKDASE